MLDFFQSWVSLVVIADVIASLALLVLSNSCERIPNSPFSLGSVGWVHCLQTCSRSSILTWDERRVVVLILCQF